MRRCSIKVTEVDFDTLVINIIHRCPSIIDGDSFQNQTRRFLPTDIHKQTLGKNRHRGALAVSITGLYKELKQRLLDETDDNDGREQLLS